MYSFRKLFIVSILTSVLTLSLSATFVGLVSADPVAPSEERVIRKGQELRVPILELHPTQFRVGFSEVARKEKKLRDKKPSKLESYIEDHEVPVVVGPDGKTLYMTDYHHRMTALLEIDAKMEVIAHVIGSYPDYLASAEKAGTKPLTFAKWMVSHNYAYLDDKGVHRPFRELPEQLGHLRNDAYRSLVGKITDDEEVEGEGTYFAEFRIANWLRGTLKLTDKAVDDLLSDPDSKESKKFLDDVGELVRSDAAKKAISSGVTENLLKDSAAACLVGRIRERLRD